MFWAAISGGVPGFVRFTSWANTYTRHTPNTPSSRSGNFIEALGSQAGMIDLHRPSIKAIVIPEMPPMSSISGDNLTRSRELNDHLPRITGFPWSPRAHLNRCSDLQVDP